MRAPIRSEIETALSPLVAELIVWNAPDHEYTRDSVRGIVESVLVEEFAAYELMGGDASQGLTSGDAA